MPLDAAIGRLFAPYRPSGRHGHRFWRKKSSCGVVTSLTAKDGHDRPLFDKLLRCLLSSPIFVRCQRLIAKKLDEFFSSNRAISQFYKACGINDVSRGSILCLFAASFGGANFTATTLVVCAQTDDPGGRRGDTV
jgi:hypothetical protein